MLSTYTSVLGRPGALAFSLSGLVARLPISMVGLGLVVLVSTRTGSYSLAGAVSASYVVANAALAVPQARLVDRFGQSRVLPLAIAVFAAGLALTMVAVEARWPSPLPHALAAVAGGALPQLGASVRARWPVVVADRRQLRTAFALEAVNDELVFIVGPTLVTLLATSVHPLAGLSTALVLGVAGTLALVAQRATEPAPHRASVSGDVPPIRWRLLVPMVGSAFFLGVLFGGCEVATVAFSDAQGAKSASGPLLAVWALGSLLSGLVTGAVPLRASSRARFRRGLLALSLLMLPLPFVEGFALLAVVLFLAGFAISPTLIAATEWVEQAVPSARITEGITVFSTGLVAGVAPGAAVVGFAVDRVGASASYWVCAVAGVAGSVLALAVGRPGTARAATDPLRP